jgi:hypothetical protein
MSERTFADVRARLAWLARIQDGWLDGHGLAVAKHVLQWTSEKFIPLIDSDGIAPPHLYPTEEGGIEMEWILGGNDISLTLTPADEGMEIYGHVLRKGTSMYFAESFEPSEHEGLVGFLRRAEVWGTSTEVIA